MRVEKNKELLERVAGLMTRKDATEDEKMLGGALMILKDMSISLAVIADALKTDKEDSND